MKLGKFITIEGPDGSGKTSVIRELCQLFDQEAIDYIITREPGGSPIAEQIREVVLHVDNGAMDPKAEALLMAAGRRQHLVDTILPAQKAGRLVLSDRFVDSSLVYQGVARAIGIEEVWKINQFAIEDHLPDLTLLIDIPAQTGLERIYKAQGKRQFDRLDQESLDFHEKVREAFLKLEKTNDRIHYVNGDQPLDAVVAECVRILKANHII